MAPGLDLHPIENRSVGNDFVRGCMNIAERTVGCVRRMQDALPIRGTDTAGRGREGDRVGQQSVGVEQIRFHVVGVMQELEQTLQVVGPALPELGSRRQIHGTATAIVLAHHLFAGVELALHGIDDTRQRLA